MAFDTSLRDQAVARERAAREELRQSVLAEVLRTLAEIAPAFDVTEVYLFGSITRPGGFHRDSDIDLAVGQSVEEPLRLAAELSVRLGREVHVITIEGGRVGAVAKREGIRWTPASS